MSFGEMGFFSCGSCGAEEQERAQQIYLEEKVVRIRQQTVNNQQSSKKTQAKHLPQCFTAHMPVNNYSNPQLSNRTHMSPQNSMPFRAQSPRHMPYTHVPVINIRPQIMQTADVQQPQTRIFASLSPRRQPAANVPIAIFKKDNPPHSLVTFLPSCQPATNITKNMPKSQETSSKIVSEQSQSREEVTRDLRLKTCSSEQTQVSSRHMSRLSPNFHAQLCHFRSKSPQMFGSHTFRPMEPSACQQRQSVFRKNKVPAPTFAFNSPQKCKPCDSPPQVMRSPFKKYTKQTFHQLQTIKSIKNSVDNNSQHSIVLPFSTQQSKEHSRSACQYYLTSILRQTINDEPRDCSIKQIQGFIGAKTKPHFDDVKTIFSDMLNVQNTQSQSNKISVLQLQIQQGNAPSSFQQKLSEIKNEVEESAGGLKHTNSFNKNVQSESKRARLCTDGDFTNPFKSIPLQLWECRRTNTLDQSVDSLMSQRSYLDTKFMQQLTPRKHVNTLM